MNKSVLIVVAIVTPLAFGGAFGVLKFTSHSSPAPAAAARPTPAAAAASTDPGMIFPLPERVLTLAPGADGAPHYARIELAIGFRRPDGVKPPKPADAAGTVTVLEPGLAPVQAHKVQIDDALVRVVGSQSYTNLATSDGREAFKRDFLDAVRQLVPSPAPQNVYIVDLLVQ